MSSKAERLERVRTDIRDACKRSGRDPSSVKLIGVSKTKSWEEVRDFLALGLMDFGENYVQEALPKIDALAAQEGPAPLWHFIGHLQSNKAKLIPGRFRLLHALDSVSLARKLDSASASLGLVQDCLVEVNLDEEPSKGGVSPAALPKLLEELNGLNSVAVKGLMCIPAPREKSRAREPFARLRELQEKIQGCYRSPLTELSMGMSGDYQEAILEGSTLVRVGTALFGERK